MVENLRLIQIEGLFDDYCRIKFGEVDNQGTLVEKAKKTLGTNEYSILRMYPYFAFEVPVLRNKVAHKGMLRMETTHRYAYNLVLDFNTLSKMVVLESIDKFVYAFLIFEKLHEKNSKAVGNTDELFDELVYELLGFDKISNNHFWKIIRNPEEYSDGIDFYKGYKLEESRKDLPQIVDTLSKLVRSEGLWMALHRLVQKHISPKMKWMEIEEFAR